MAPGKGRNGRPVDFATLPFPGFHTDMHPQMVALLSVATGTSVITENLYDSRFRYVGELARMGADITTEAQHAIIRGVERLWLPVLAPDIRAGAALVLPVCAPRVRPWWARRATSTGATRSSRRGSDRWERE